MELNYGGISLRDYSYADIQDDIRWLNVDNDWILLDTPWVSIDTVDEDEYRELMEFHVEAVSQSDAFRTRLEIYHENKHIGFVSAYFTDQKHEITDSKRAKQLQISVQICESDYRGKGFGTHALSAYAKYCAENVGIPITLRTHSQNLAMLKIAVKLGFEPIERVKGAFTMLSKSYDVIYFIKNN